MGELERLLQVLPTGVFTLKDAQKVGVSRYYLVKLIDENLLDEIKKGVFQRPREEDPQVTSFKAATATLTEKSAICLWSALSYYGLTDEVPGDVWCLVTYPYGNRSVKTIRLKDPRWDVGVVAKDGFSITSIERTIVDCFIHQKYIPKKDAVNSLQLCVNKDFKGHTSVKKLLRIAGKLNAKNKILPFLEAFL